MACGSAVETRSFDAATGWNASESNQDPFPAILARYHALVDPQDGMFQLTPFSSQESLAQQTLSFRKDGVDYLSSTLNNISIVSGTGRVTHYDAGTNKIRVFEKSADAQNSGLCVINDESDGVEALQAELLHFTSATVAASEGASSSGTSYLIEYGDVPVGVKSCRTFSLTNSSSTAYSFAVYFLGTVTTLSSPKYVSMVDDAIWTYPSSGSKVITVTGSGFGDSPTLWVGAQQIATDSASDTQVVATISSALTAGQLKVNDGSSDILGSFILDPKAVSVGVRLPPGQGTKTGKLEFRSFASQLGVCLADGSGCPAGSNGDIEYVQNFTISDSDFTIATFSYIGPNNDCFYITFDSNGNETIGNGDHSKVVGPTALTAGENTGLANTTLASISHSGECF